MEFQANFFVLKFSKYLNVCAKIGKIANVIKRETFLKWFSTTVSHVFTLAVRQDDHDADHVFFSSLFRN